MAQTNSGDYNLVIRQQPRHAKVAIGKEKGTSSNSSAVAPFADSRA